MIKRNKLGQFVKGFSPWNKGIPHSELTKQKISNANRGRKRSQIVREKISRVLKGRIPWNKGRKMTDYPQVGFPKGHNLGGKSPNWKGGKIKIQGYWWIYQLNHPKAQLHHCYVKQAILVAEKYLGRHLTKQEVVHHIGAKDDDRPEMLYLFPSREAHTAFENLKNKPQLKSNLINT
jgi:hypothetical protein